MNGSEKQAVAAPVQAAAIKEDWGRGAVPDAAAVLARHPELLADKSIVLDLAYEEYCLRAEAGVVLETEAFCARFPAHRSSIRRLITAHQFLALNSSVLGSMPPARWPEAGERWGDFTLLRELGRGAFARVYLATEATTGDRPVAVKFSFEGGAEARTLGRLNHPNIVPVLSARVDPATGLVAVCMPFLGGATLTDVLDLAYLSESDSPPQSARIFIDAARSASRSDDPLIEETPPDKRLVRGSYEDGVALIGEQLAEALAFLHARDVYHLDLKPSNVLLAGGGRPMLLDFNLSIDARNGPSRPGGTLPYIAPEQAEMLIAESAAAGAADGRCDVYSLGAILYELLVGKTPFGSLPNMPLRELAPLLLQMQRKGHPPLRTLRPRVDRKLASLIDRCLAFDPAARPQSAAAVASQLRGILRARRRARFARRAGGLLMVCALLLIGSAWLPRSPGHFERGQVAFESCEYDKAAKFFQLALDKDPGDIRARRAQALTCLKISEAVPAEKARKEISLALQNFIAVEREQPNPSNRANIGYCLSRQGQHTEAIFEYTEAETAGFRTSALYNNRAHSHLCRNEIEAAEADLTKALTKEPNLAAAYHNRAFLALLRWQREGDRHTALLGQKDAVRAIELGLESPDLYFDAARLTVAANEAGATDEALRYLAFAIDSGKTRKAITTDARFCQYFGENKDFRQLLERQPSHPTRAARTRLVIPGTTFVD
jgi:serine/threonine protein kinase